MKVRHLGEGGQILAFTAIAMVAMLSLAALALDGGLALETKRRAQTAADNAAIAGAVVHKKNPMTTELVSTGREHAEQNGFVHGVAGVNVEMNNPPESGPYAGDSDYVEAIVTQQQPSMLLRALGITTMLSGGRAVAGPGDSNLCILVLDPTAQAALTMSGSASIIAPECTVAVNSNHSRAISESGSACINADTISIVGNYIGTCFTPEPDTGAGAEEDPFADHDTPAYGGCTYTNYVITSTSPPAAKTLNPGTYCGGIRISSTPGVTFNPGVYVLLGGGLQVSGGSTTLTGSDVTFFVTGNATRPYDAVVISGGGVVNLSAPTSGPMEAMLFFQDPAITSTKVNTISGGSTMNLEGALYFPTTKLKYTGGSVNHGDYTVIVARLLELTGPSGIGTDYTGLDNGSPVKTRVTLAE